LEKTLHKKKKRAGGEAQGVGPEFNPQYQKKKKKKNLKKSTPRHITVQLLEIKTRKIYLENSQDCEFETNLNYIMSSRPAWAT
jgi:hypothetical protein